MLKWGTVKKSLPRKLFLKHGGRGERENNAYESEHGTILV